MRATTFLLVLLIALTSAYAAGDSAKVRSKLQGAYSKWESSVGQANRDYHREVVEIRQAQLKEAEAERDQLAKARRFDEIAEATEQIKAIEEAIDAARDAIRDGSPPNPAAGVNNEEQADDPRTPKTPKDWHVGDWNYHTLTLNKFERRPRNMKRDGTVSSTDNGGMNGKIVHATETSVVLQWGENDFEYWHRMHNGRVTVVHMVDDKFASMGKLEKRE